MTDTTERPGLDSMAAVLEHLVETVAAQRKQAKEAVAEATVQRLRGDAMEQLARAQVVEIRELRTEIERLNGLLAEPAPATHKRRGRWGR